jgi:hypothetical protein
VSTSCDSSALVVDDQVWPLPHEGGSPARPASCIVRAMSNFALEGDDHPEAAGKHLDDATALWSATRYDGAGYLTGYVLECCFKTLLILHEVATSARLSPRSLAGGLAAGGPAVQTGVRQGMRAARRLKHDLDGLSREALRLAALPGATTAAYVPSIAGASIYAAGWTESLRYQKPGCVGQVMSRQWLMEARRVYQSTVAQMRRDGVLFG